MCVKTEGGRGKKREKIIIINEHGYCAPRVPQGPLYKEKKEPCYNVGCAYQ